MQHRAIIALATSAVLTACAMAEKGPECAPDNAGLTLPQGFCAQIVADSVGNPRHIAVAPNGDLYLALRDSTASVLVLRDADGDGVAEQREKFGAKGGTGMAFFDNHVYASTDTSIVRWPWTDGPMVPSGAQETIVTELAVQRGHTAKPFTIASDGSLYVTIGAPSNSCQEKDREEGSKGLNPCPLLENSGGIWRFDARKPMQRFADGTRRVTGVRNMVALNVGPDGSTLWGVQHGRDLLAGNWGKQHPVFTETKSAENPAEELFRLDDGADFGWPYCYYDVDLKKKVMSPEYGGDGQAEGRCATVAQPLVAFPGHWAPESIVFYNGTAFPAEYHGGAFVAFHGSWNRAPLEQAGFNVSFVPFANGQPTGSYKIFADGFRGDSTQQLHRPMGMAVTADGALIVGDDKGGRIYRIWFPNAK
ncbi:MAG TPA: PQQ-dependent sugar dehydrogenase [Gemmatimonadaceae bacterium]